MSLPREIEEQGFSIVPTFLTQEEVDALLHSLDALQASGAVKQKNGSVYGVRDLLNQLPALREFATGQKVRDLVAPLFETAPKLVRAIYFDKTQEANWIVPWHQDTTIATREKRVGQGFEQWTVKTDIPHVKPPVEYLQRMVTLSIHLDDCTEHNGTLKVIPGSHRHGMLPMPATLELAARETAFVCDAPRGSVMIMRPLLVHSSAVGDRPDHRRVLHFEFSADVLPYGLEWFDAA